MKSLNNMSSQLVGLLLVLIGCGMILAVRKFGIESSIGTTLIGGGLGMLQSTFNKTLTEKEQTTPTTTTTSSTELRVTPTPEPIKIVPPAPAPISGLQNVPDFTSAGKI